MKSGSHRVGVLLFAVVVGAVGVCSAENENTTAPTSQEKVVLEPPQAAAKPAESADTGKLAEELKSMPDGVLKVKTNEDGSFKSLVVKATVEVEDVLGGEKGKRLARKEAETKCKEALTKWLEESCAFVEGASKTTTIVTKGDSSTDAAGNKVLIRGQKGTETKVLTENSVSLAKAWLRGLIMLHSEITTGANPQCIAIMGMSDKTLQQASQVKATLSGKTPAPEPGKDESSKKPESGSSDAPAPEKQLNPEAKDFM